jgi:hypothetical protein
MEFRKWLEMSMDLSDIEDPFDPDFHKAISSKKKKAVLYHGTSTRWFWDIVNNGFVFSPDRKNFDNTSPGVFFSFDAGRTDLYAHRASKNHGGEEIMFVAELPVSMLERDIDDKDTWDKDAKVQTMVRNTVPPKFITGVIYPISYGNLSGGNVEIGESLKEALRVREEQSERFLFSFETLSKEDALELRTHASFRSYQDTSRYIVLTARAWTREAQNALLKMLEEPGPNTHFFLLAQSAEVFFGSVLLIVTCF